MYLNSLTVFGYSVGHIHNDLCSAMWFTYLLIFLESVLNFDAKTAGTLLLIGQITDAIATPLVGLESDRDLPFCQYGKRKSWHLFGTVASAISFPMIFQRCYGAVNSDLSALAFYYSALIIIFQISWASVQISHLSLATELTPYSTERVKLVARRSGFQVASNILVYLITWLVLHTNSESGKDKFSPSDESHFRLIAILITAIGVSFSFLFHSLVKESSANTVDAGLTSSGNLNLAHRSNHLRWYDWLKLSIFYKVAILYMSTRLVVNLSQVFIPMYLQYSLNLHKESCAYIPLAIYCSGYFGSILVEQSSHYICKKNILLFGACLSIVGYIWIYFGTYPNFAKYHIYFVAIILGFSSQVILINSMSILNDLIGHNTSSSAFVFGAMSFCDKLSNGFAVVIIQFLRPESMICNTGYFRNILVFVCGGASILAALSLFSIYFQNFTIVRQTPNQLADDTQPPDDQNVVTSQDDTNESRPLLAQC